MSTNKLHPADVVILIGIALVAAVGFSLAWKAGIAVIGLSLIWVGSRLS